MEQTSAPTTDEFDFDLIVVGGGSVGLSTAFHAGKRSLRTLVIEQFDFCNDHGSSAGASRQFRVQYSQQYMAELALSAQPFWAEAQQYSDAQLKGDGGSLWFGDPALDAQEGGIKAAMQTMDTLRVAYHSLPNAADIESAFAFADIPSEYAGFSQADGGIINLKATETALYEGAELTGNVAFHSNETVCGIESLPDGTITVSTDRGTYRSKQLAVTAGPYANTVLQHLGLAIDLDIWEMSSAYYKITDPSLTLPTWFVFQKPTDTSLFYGFPEVDWAHPGYIRVAPDIPDRIIKNPDDRTGIPSKKSLALNEAWVRDHMPGLDPTSEFSSTCLIALSTGSDAKELLLDYAPSSVANNSNIVTYTAGWAAKFIPVLGDMICQMLAQPDLQSFDYGDYQISRSNFAIDWTTPSPYTATDPTSSEA